MTRGDNHYEGLSWTHKPSESEKQGWEGAGGLAGNRMKTSYTQATQKVSPEHQKRIVCFCLRLTAFYVLITQPEFTANLSLFYIFNPSNSSRTKDQFLFYFLNFDVSQSLKNELQDMIFRYQIYNCDSSFVKCITYNLIGKNAQTTHKHYCS